MQDSTSKWLDVKTEGFLFSPSFLQKHSLIQFFAKVSSGLGLNILLVAKKSGPIYIFSAAASLKHRLCRSIAMKGDFDC